MYKEACMPCPLLLARHDNLGEGNDTQSDSPPGRVRSGARRRNRSVERCSASTAACVSLSSVLCLNTFTAGCGLGGAGWASAKH